MKRVMKPKKPDALFEPTLATDIKRTRVQSAVWDYDRAIVEAEKIWGVDRLPMLVDQEMRAKWWRNVEALNQAITANDDEKVRAIVPNLIKGIGKMIEMASLSGHGPIEYEAWETPMGDKILRITRAWPEYADRVDPRPGVVTYSIEAVARILQDRASVVNKVLEAFPGAQVKAVRSKLEEELNDEIPF